MPSVNVVDLSHYQSDPDFSDAQAAGIVGVFHKATEGTSYTDPTFAGRKKAAAAVGMPFVSYHFLKGGSIQAQVSHYLDVVQPVQGERVVLDHEADATLDELRQAVKLLQADPRNLQVTIYSGSLIEQQLGTTRDSLLASCALWTPEYTSKPEPTWPKATWPVWSLWQFTDKAKVPGFAEPVDGNTFNGSPAACERWMRPVAGTTIDVTDTTDAVVTITIHTPPGVTVNVVRN